MGIRHRFPALAAFALALCALAGAHVPPAHGRQAGPEIDFCAEVNRLSPGDELILLPGRYPGPCTIRSGGTAQRPIVVRSADLQRPAVVVYHGRTANVLDIKADHVVIRGLAFESMHPDADGIRLYARENVVIEDCQFANLGGIAVVANHNSARKIVVRRNIVKQSRATAMYFGCHDGRECTIDDLLIERNYIHGVSAPDPMVGYGIQVKLNSVAVIRDNVIVDTKGPGIMVYGADDSSKRTIVERNFVAGSRHSSGILVGGGPALVQNNISVRNARAGIAVENYGRRDLLHRIVISHNTAADNARGAVTLPEKGPLEAAVAHNAAMARADEKLFPDGRSGLEARGNYDCTQRMCFSNAEIDDYSPVPASPLRNALPSDAAFVPAKDFFGAERGRRPTLGAIQNLGGPIRMGIKPDEP